MRLTFSAVTFAMYLLTSSTLQNCTERFVSFLFFFQSVASHARVCYWPLGFLRIWCVEEVMYVIQQLQGALCHLSLEKQYFGAEAMFCYLWDTQCNGITTLAEKGSSKTLVCRGIVASQRLYLFLQVKRWIRTKALHAQCESEVQNHFLFSEPEAYLSCFWLALTLNLKYCYQAKTFFPSSRNRNHLNQTMPPPPLRELSSLCQASSAQRTAVTPRACGGAGHSGLACSPPTEGWLRSQHHARQQSLARVPRQLRTCCWLSAARKLR